MNTPVPLTCAASDCSNSFYQAVPNQKFCCERCCNRQRVRDYRAKHRKKGGPGGGGNGGGGGPTLFDTITPVDPREAFVPGVIPVIGPDKSGRKPAVTVTEPNQKSRKAAA